MIVIVIRKLSGLLRENVIEGFSDLQRGIGGERRFGSLEIQREIDSFLLLVKIDRLGEDLCPVVHIHKVGGFVLGNMAVAKIRLQQGREDGSGALGLGGGDIAFQIGTQQLVYRNQHVHDQLGADIPILFVIAGYAAIGFFANQRFGIILNVGMDLVPIYHHLGLQLGIGTEADHAASAKEFGFDKLIEFAVGFFAVG